MEELSREGQEQVRELTMQYVLHAIDNGPHFKWIKRRHRKEYLAAMRISGSPVGPAFGINQGLGVVAAEAEERFTQLTLAAEQHTGA
jgi:hypothetical protein